MRFWLIGATSVTSVANAELVLLGTRFAIRVRISDATLLLSVTRFTSRQRRIGSSTPDSPRTLNFVCLQPTFIADVRILARYVDPLNAAR